MLNIRELFTWLAKQFLVYFLPIFNGVLDISGCLLRFSLWMFIFSISSLLNIIGFVFLAAIWILGLLTSLLERGKHRRKRRAVSNPVNKRSRGLSLPNRNGFTNSNMDYDEVIRTTRGLYNCSGNLTRSRRDSPNWFPDRYDYDSSYFTDTPRTASSASWGTGRARFQKVII